MQKNGFSINPLVAGVDAPPIPEAQSWRAAYGGRFGPLIDLSQAVPGHAPPDAFLARLAAAAGDGQTARYGPILGDLALREAHAKETNRIYHAGISAENVAITAGCNMAFIVAIMAVAQAGDEVILPTPWYFNHKMALDMLGIRTVALPCRAENGFVPNVADLQSRITPATRAVVLVSPNNPTGSIYPTAIIELFATTCAEHSIALILDETYRDFLPDGTHHDLFTNADWGRRLIQLYSFSKAYAIPGYRLGALVAATEVIKHIAKVLDTLQICPARAAQSVTAWAIEGVRAWREQKAAEVSARGAACRRAFETLPGWQLDSVGAYFAFARHPFSNLSARDAARQLAEEAGILALPGSYFGSEHEQHLRLAIANVDEQTLALLPERLQRLKALNEIKK